VYKRIEIIQGVVNINEPSPRWRSLTGLELIRKGLPCREELHKERKKTHTQGVELKLKKPKKIKKLLTTLSYPFRGTCESSPPLEKFHHCCFS
jgi:hypothetical protein